MDKPNPDLGRYNVTKKEQDRGAFKTPTIRNIAARAPKNPNLSKELRPLGLTAQQKADLVAFLKSLSCPDLKVVTPAASK